MMVKRNGVSYPPEQHNAIVERMKNSKMLESLKTPIKKKIDGEIDTDYFCKGCGWCPDYPESHLDHCGGGCEILEKKGIICFTPDGELVIRKAKNQLDNLPSELVIYVYSFLDEKKRHNDYFQQLFIDKSFNLMMWNSFQGRTRRGGYEIHSNVVDIEKEDDVYERFENAKRNKKKYETILPSDIHILKDGDDFDINYKDPIEKKVKNIHLLYYNEDEMEDLIGEYFDDNEEELQHINESVLAQSLSLKAIQLGFREEDMIRFRENGDYQSIKKLINMEDLEECINTYYLDDYIENIFRGDSSFQAYEGYMRIMDDSETTILD
jgi:rubrerythrin